LKKVPSKLHIIIKKIAAKASKLTVTFEHLASKYPKASSVIKEISTKSSEIYPPLKEKSKKLFKDKNFKKILAVTLLIFSTGIVLKGCPGKKESRDLSPFTITAEKGKLSSTISASGELQAERSLNINPHRQGLIYEVYVEEGDTVLQNQLIAKIDSRDFPFRLNELQTEFENKQDSYTRRKYLFEEGAISEESYKEYLKDFLTSKARLDQLKVEGKELLIRAPFKGIITAKYAEPGSFVSPNSPSATTEGTSKTAVVEISQGLIVLAKVPESDIGRIKIGQKGIIRVEAFPEERFKAKVNYIAPRALKSNNVTSFEVKLVLIDPPKKLRIGMTSDVEFQSEETGLQTLVPTVAIVTQDGEPGLLIVGNNNEPVFNKVELGSSSGSKTAIVSGIEVGQTIFIDLPPWAKRGAQ